MNRRFFGVLTAALLLASALFGQVAQTGARENTILRFNSMVGVPAAYTGVRSPIRGVNGGGLPWVVGEAHGELRRSGELKIEVEGLVFDPHDPAVIARGIGGTNTVASFGAIVSCQTIDPATGAATVKNVATPLFPATVGAASDGGGSAEIEAVVALPQPCIAPIVFVTSPGGSWFATTGL